MKLVSETSKLNNLVRSAGKEKVRTVLNLARDTDLKIVPTFQLRQCKVEKFRLKQYSGTPCILTGDLCILFRSLQRFR